MFYFFLNRINARKRNPIYPGALRLCDVANGVPYLLICASSDHIDTGNFLSKPSIQKMDFSKLEKNIAKTIDRFGYIDEQRFLDDMGICPYFLGRTSWDETYFTILNTPKGLKAYQAWLDNGGKEKLLQIEVTHRRNNANIFLWDEEEEEE